MCNDKRIMNTKSFLQNFMTKKVVITALAVVAAAIIAVVSLNGDNGKQRFVVKRADIVQTVAATGKVKPDQSVNLGFDKSGRVENIYADVGDRVKKGQIIASLETGEIRADISKAKASLEEEIVKLGDIKNTAPVSYNDAYKNLESTIKKGFVSADNAVRNRADQFFENTSSNPQFKVSFTDGNFVHYFNVPSDTATDINGRRMDVENILTEWQKRIFTLNVSNVATEANFAIENLSTISIFLDKIAGAINTFSPAEYDYEATVNTYKTTISSARMEVSGAISEIVTAKDKFNSVGTLQEGEFNSILTQEAKVSQARATLSSLEASLGKSIIKAPFDGILTLQDAKLGSTVSAGTPLVSMMSEGGIYYIEANISEINIGKVSAGNKVVVTFDAFPLEEFSGSVSYIEPGDFIIDGVVNYKIKVNLDKIDERIKNGLTTNLKIETSKKEGVLAVPLYAVTKDEGINFVTKIVGKEQQKTPVSLGISGNDGFVEVLSGLNVGDVIEF